MYDISGGEPQRVVVIGQGYVGLPVAIRAVEVGFGVVGFDIDKTRIDCLRKSETFIDDITGRDLAIAMSTGRYLPTDDAEALAGFDVAVVCVPTPLRDGAPDLSYVEDAAVLITPHITPGCCVILESTSYPGTTEEIFIPILEAGSGLRAGAQFFAGYSPERIDPGSQIWRFQNTPKIICESEPGLAARVARTSMIGSSSRRYRCPGFGRLSWPSCWSAVRAGSDRRRRSGDRARRPRCDRLGTLRAACRSDPGHSQPAAFPVRRATLG